MSFSKTDILVYAHWLGMEEPTFIGVLTAHQAKGRKAFSFEYSDGWIQSKAQLLLDPDIGWYKGQQFPYGKENFGMVFDSMPDSWGKTLMKRRSAYNATHEGKTPQNLYDIDFLLGVNDECRLGALRFKLTFEGPFLDIGNDNSIPPLSRIIDLQYAAQIVEEDNNDLSNWLSVLIAPGSSLGGARPKANVLDDKGNLWIAKFPSVNDVTDKASWEFLAYTLALKSGVEMSESRIEKISGKYHTFFTKRFDRLLKERIHFASAMTMTGYNEEILKEKTASYLDIAEFIQFSGSQIKKDLNQLWRRIVFNIAISNTDDHLRNHGFILSSKGWILSPAFDINPSIDKSGLSLNIDANDNDLNFELAKSVGEYFQLKVPEMEQIIGEVTKTVSSWRNVAQEIGISKNDQELMASAFKC